MTDLYRFFFLHKSEGHVLSDCLLDFPCNCPPVRLCNHLLVCQGSAGSLGAAGSGSVSDLHSRLRRRRCHHQLQVPADWRADPQTPHPGLQEELPPQPQGTCRTERSTNTVYLICLTNKGRKRAAGADSFSVDLWISGIWMADSVGNPKRHK